MTRWHLAGCRAPDIEVRGLGPFCKACSAEPDVQKLIAAKKNDSPFPPCPADEAPGQFNFSWPPTVPYFPQHRVGGDTVAGQSNTLTSETDIAGASSGAGDPSPSSPLYPRQLRPDELRLIILPASADGTFPMHVDLEIHQDGRCPEYETVSYSWGGEDGNSSSACPLFVGPHWDVLLLTKNCWDMLRFLRPWRGSRMVWVDSICINQDDVQEREAQVAKMARIYSECRQAVVYLGEDVVKPTMPGEYPSRRQLEDSIGSLPVDFFSLLTRRYFSRVWIIQELILPRQIIIPVGDMEICADKQSGKSLSPRYDWASTAAPWIMQIGQRTLPPHEGNIYDILRLTSQSKSTDPRDKVFGAHALINNSEDDRLALRPDYSLSCLHVFFGAFAHSLINLKRTDLLCNAAGIAGKSGYPSWTPNWTSPGSIETWFQKGTLEWETGRRRAWAPGEGRWAGEAFHTWWRGNSSERAFQTPSTNSVMHVCADARKWRTSSEMTQDQKILACSWSLDVPVELFSTEAEHLDVRSRLQRRWDRNPVVDALTGSLSLHLIHLLSFQVVPQQVGGVVLGAKLFRVPALAGEAEMYLTTDTSFALDQHIQPGLDHLFLLDRGKSTPPLYLVMRKCNTNAASPWSYTLLVCCYHLCFYADPGTWTRRSIENTYDRWEYTMDSSPVEREVPRLDEDLFLADLQPNLQDTIKSVQHKALHPLTSVTRDYQLSDVLFKFARKKDPEKSLRAFQGLLNEKRGATPGFLDSYAAILDEYYRPVVRGEYVEVQIQPQDWEDVYHHVRHLYREWRYDESSEWSTSRTVRYSLFRSSKKPVTIRAHKRDLEKIALESGVCDELSRLTRAALREGEDEVTMVERCGMKEDLRSTDPVWPKSIVEGFGIDGFTYRVTIV